MTTAVTTRVGDQVVLNSGGPAMTVLRVDATTDRLDCAWYHDDDELEHAWLPAVCVRALEGEG